MEESKFKRKNLKEFKASLLTDPRAVDKLYSISSKDGLLPFLEEMTYSQLKNLTVGGKGVNKVMQKRFMRAMDHIENEFTAHFQTSALAVLVDAVYAAKHGVKALEAAKAELKQGIGRD